MIKLFSLIFYIKLPRANSKQRMMGRLRSYPAYRPNFGPETLIIFIQLWIYEFICLWNIMLISTVPDAHTNYLVNLLSYSAALGDLIVLSVLAAPCFRSCLPLKRGAYNTPFLLRCKLFFKFFFKKPLKNKTAYNIPTDWLLRINPLQPLPLRSPSLAGRRIIGGSHFCASFSLHFYDLF